MRVEDSAVPLVQGDAPNVGFITRSYETRDREIVRKICADTGFLGQPIDPVFEDREIFCDYMTAYYTDMEPESTLVTEIDGQVVGYLMGSRNNSLYKQYRIANNIHLFLRGIFRYFNRPYNSATRRYIKWVLNKSSKQSPHTPKNMPHFHLNLLPPARNVAQTRSLVDRFLAYLLQAGERSVYGQVVTFDKRRGVRMFERYGFEVKDQVEVTKFNWIRPEPIFLFTIVKDLTLNSQLYGKDLARIRTNGQ